MVHRTTNQLTLCVFFSTVTQVRVTFCHYKPVEYDDQTWQADPAGYDACRAEKTCAAHTTTPLPHNDRTTRAPDSRVGLGAWLLFDALSARVSAGLPRLTWSGV